MIGRVPDLPVKPDLPPERSFPAPRPKAGTKKSRGNGGAAGEGGKRASRPRAGARGARGEKRPALYRIPALPARPDSLPREAGDGARRAVGRARERGNARQLRGHRGKATGKEGVTEEGGGGFRLTPLNAPEIQYISYFASIKRKIELVWQYPYDAAVHGIQGDLQIDFVIGRSGKVEGIELVRGSGHKILDDEAVRSIRKASPFDPIPAEYKIPNLVIRGRFIYVHGGALRLR
jgi:TonB family protein